MDPCDLGTGVGKLEVSETLLRKILEMTTLIRTSGTQT